MNTFIISGRLTRDPELSSSSKGTFCRFSVAVRRPFSKTEITDFFPCTAWRSQAEFIAKYFKKGSRILVTGHMTSSSYTSGDEKRTGYDWIVDTVEFNDNKEESVNPEIEVTPKKEVTPTKICEIDFTK